MYEALDGLLRHDAAPTVLGIVIGMLVAFALSAILGRNALTPFGRRRYRGFSAGRYVLYAPSREFKDSMGRWETTVRKTLFGRLRFRLFMTWEDHGLNAFEYRGPVMMDDRYTIVRLNAVVRRSGTHRRDGKRYRAPAIENDPAFLVMEKATGPWSVRPVVISGFDGQGHCYSAIGVMTDGHVELSESDVASLVSDTCHRLDYADVRRRISQRLHAQAITADLMAAHFPEAEILPPERA
jgi:hypothetical protein